MIGLVGNMCNIFPDYSGELSGADTTLRVTQNHWKWHSSKENIPLPIVNVP